MVWGRILPDRARRDHRRCGSSQPGSASRRRRRMARMAGGRRVACSTTCYTGFLFAQGSGARSLAGPSSRPSICWRRRSRRALRRCCIGARSCRASRPRHRCAPLPLVLIAAMVVHLGLLAFENLARARARRATASSRSSAIRRGPFARLFWGGAIAVSIAAVIVVAWRRRIPSALALGRGARAGRQLRVGIRLGRGRTVGAALMRLQISEFRLQIDCGIADSLPCQSPICNQSEI
mgnify:CR=1 FL=1